MQAYYLAMCIKLCAYLIIIPIISVQAYTCINLKLTLHTVQLSQKTNKLEKGGFCLVVGHKSKSKFVSWIILFIYQPFWTQAYSEGMCMNRNQVPCEVPSLLNPTTRKGWPHHQGLWPLLVSNSDVGSFTSHKNKSVKVLWDGTYGFLSLSEKTRKSNHLQMSLQRQHFLHSYLKTLSVGPARVWTCDLVLLSRPNQAACVASVSVKVPCESWNWRELLKQIDNRKSPGWSKLKLPTLASSASSGESSL